MVVIRRPKPIPVEDVNVNPKRKRKIIGKTSNDGKLDVRCWCERSIVRVSKENIRRGFTDSCGAAMCNKIHYEATRERIQE